MLTRRCGVCGKPSDKPGQVHRHKGKKVYRWTHVDKTGMIVKHHDFHVEVREGGRDEFS